MNKSQVNFIIDALMFLFMMAIAGLGFLMKFILIPGHERWEKYGRNVELTLFGMDRHEWGTIHLIIAFVLLGALALHIILHWKAILALYQRLIANQKARRVLAVSFVIVSAFLVFAPLTVSPRVLELGRGEGRIQHDSLAGGSEIDQGSGDYGRGRSHQTHQHRDSSVEVRGYMTLADVAEKYNVPVDRLKAGLGMPESAPSNERLGWLRDEYDFTMSDVERVIEENAKSQ